MPCRERFLSLPAALSGSVPCDFVFDRFSCDLTAIPELFPRQGPRIAIRGPCLSAGFVADMWETGNNFSIFMPFSERCYKMGIKIAIIEQIYAVK